MRVLLSGGGTGGHVYPVLTIVEHLRNTLGRRGVEFMYLGNEESIEAELCERARVPFQSISAGAVRGMGVATRLTSAVQLFRGTAQSLRAIATFDPDVTFVTGGYVSVPPVIASRIRRRPILIYLPDLEPGLAIRTTARFAQRVAVSFPEVVSHFAEGKAVVTGYPVRRAFYETDQDTARKRLGLDESVPTLMVMGGSRGAQPINRAVARNLEALLDTAQVVHLSGHWDITWLEEARAKLTPRRQSRYHLHAYLHDGLVDAMAAADLVIARAGAATLAEFPAVGLPAILVPYPYSGQHQEANADFMVARGAAVKVHDSELADTMPALVRDMLAQESRLAEMRAKAQEMARPDAAANIAQLLLDLAGQDRSKQKEN